MERAAPQQVQGPSGCFRAPHRIRGLPGFSGLSVLFSCCSARFRFRAVQPHQNRDPDALLWVAQVAGIAPELLRIGVLHLGEEMDEMLLFVLPDPLLLQLLFVLEHGLKGHFDHQGDRPDLLRISGDADNALAPVTVQVNPLKTTADKLLAELSNAGVAAKPHPWVQDCLELSGVGDLTTLPAFYRGEFLVQDAAARLASLGIERGMDVLYVCAAPGGKSFSAGFAMGYEGRIVSCDLHENKLKRIRDGAARLGVTCIETEAADGRVFRPEWAERFDAVLCDVPCSGLGIIRKKPDIRYKDMAAFAALPEIQGAILENAAHYVKPGGLLVYSTCTVLPEENGAVTAAFLRGHSDFAPVPDAHGPDFWPQRDQTDGFYIFRMRRTA